MTTSLRVRRKRELDRADLQIFRKPEAPLPGKGQPHYGGVVEWLYV